MGVISGGRIIEGSGLGSPLLNAGAPAAGTNEVQTLTIGGTPDGGTFKLALDGHETTAISWAAVNATLLASINAALDALPNSAASAIVATAGTLTAGIGTVTLTFSGAPLNRKAVNTMTAPDNSLTGTAPTLAVAETTPGVDATARGIAEGGLLLDTTNKKLYVNTGTSYAPTWTVAGAQS
jgi:hypothetical protein